MNDHRDLSPARGALALLALVVAAVAAPACTTDPDHPDGAARADAGPPPPVDPAGARCALSADCPAGTHCDLGECVQACNVRAPCGTALACTPRGRCAAVTDAGAPEPEPPPAPPSGLARVEPTLRALTPDDAEFTVRVMAPGRVRYRVEPGAPWLRVGTLRGEFTDVLALRVEVDPAAAPRDGSTATLAVVTTAGRAEVQVNAPAQLTGVYRGVIAFDRVRVRDASGAMLGEAPLDLGATRLGVQLREERGVVQARVEPGASLLWPASGEGGPAQGTGTLAMNQLDVRVAQRLEPADLAALFPESPRVLGARPVGRELRLSLAVSGTGALVGGAVERIHGVTAEPLELVGTVRLDLVADARVADFTVGIPPELPAGPRRDPGPVPLDACARAAGCAPGSGTVAARQCVLAAMRSGFPLDAFYEATDTGGGFRMTDPVPAGQTPYSAAAARCRDEIGPDPRADRAGAGLAQCVQPLVLQCARYHAAVLARESDPARMQGAHDVARAWGELFALLGNDEMVAAFRAGYGATDPGGAMRARYVAARAAFDAGLARLLDPRLLEELRGVTPAVANGGLNAPGRPNDRIALRRIADLLGGSLRATAETLALDGAASTDRAALRERAARDAVGLWIATAAVADLDARWRASASAEPAAEVLQLGAVLTSLDRVVAALAPDVNPLGLPRTYVPLLARTSSGGDGQTNYERLAAIAERSAGEASAAEAEARAAVRAFDAAADQVAGELVAARRAYAEEIRALCGNDFVRGDDAVERDLSRCGTSTGQLRDIALAGESARLQLAEARERVNALSARIALQRETMVRVRGLREADIAFVDRDNREIELTSQVQIALRVGERLLDYSSRAQFWNAGAPVLMGVAAAAIEAVNGQLTAQRERLARAQQMRALRSSAEEVYVRDMAALRELEIQRAGLLLEVATRSSELLRAITQAATARERLVRLIADWQLARAWATRRFVNDPAFRLDRDRATARARAALERARLDVYLAARALEYETNTQQPALASAVFAAQTASELGRARGCVAAAWDQWRRLVSSTNEYVTEVSLRRDVLGITGPRRDEVTGETIAPGEQFRRALFAQPYAYNGRVWPALRFGTTLRPDSALFSALVCNDRVATVEAQLVGDFLGDNQAAVQVLVDGAGLLRACDAPAGAEQIVPWNLRPDGQPAPAAVQAGVNSFGTAAPNQSLAGFAVAQSTWVVAVPDGATAPANRDVDVTRVDDIVLRIRHAGAATGSAAGMFAPSCR